MIEIVKTPQEQGTEKQEYPFTITMTVNDDEYKHDDQPYVHEIECDGYILMALHKQEDGTVTCMQGCVDAQNMGFSLMKSAPQVARQLLHGMILAQMGKMMGGEEE